MPCMRARHVCAQREVPAAPSAARPNPQLLRARAAGRRRVVRVSVQLARARILVLGKKFIANRFIANANQVDRPWMRMLGALLRSLRRLLTRPPARTPTMLCPLRGTWSVPPQISTRRRTRWTMPTTTNTPEETSPPVTSRKPHR